MKQIAEPRRTFLRNLSLLQCQDSGARSRLQRYGLEVKHEPGRGIPAGEPLIRARCGGEGGLGGTGAGSSAALTHVCKSSSGNSERSREQRCNKSFKRNNATRTAGIKRSTFPWLPGALRMKKSEWLRDDVLPREKQRSQGNLNPEILRKIPGRSGYFSKGWRRDVSAALWFPCMAFVLWCCKGLQQMPLHPPLHRTKWEAAPLGPRASPELVLPARSQLRSRGDANAAVMGNTLLRRDGASRAQRALQLP